MVMMRRMIRDTGRLPLGLEHLDEIEVVDAAGTSLGERSLESAEASCDQLGELATVTIALMIDPLTAPEPAPAPDPEPEPQEDPPPDPEPEVIVQTVEVPVPVEPDPSQGWRFEVDANISLFTPISLLTFVAVWILATLPSGT